MLILSRFTGASNELRDAILINPYDADEMAEAIRVTLDMRPEERRRRMHRMRELVKDQNIYRWAGTLINELSNVQIEVPKIANSIVRAAGNANIA
jgi:trehalose 6-phosphate synthase